MLSPRVIAVIVFIWIIGALLGGLYEMEYLGGSEQSLLNKVLFYKISTTSSSLGTTELAGNPLDYVKTLWQFATFQFSFITGEAELARWIIFGPLTAYVVVGLIFNAIYILGGRVG